MNKEIRKYLIDLARKRGDAAIVHYQPLCDSFNLKLNMRDNPYDRKVIGEILGEISTFEHSRGRPLLSALVLSKNFEEGDGFYKLAEELGFGNWLKLKNEEVFQSIQMNRCYEFWRDDQNYIRFYDDDSI